MRLLFLSGWFPYPPDNGARLRVYNLVRQLATRHEIVLLSFVRAGRPSPERTPMVSYCQAVETVPFRPFRPHRLRALLGLLSPQPRSLIATRSPKMEVLIRRTLQERSYDLIIASEIGTGTGMSSYVTGKEGIPCVLEDLELSMIQSKIQAQHTWVGQWRHLLTWWKLQGYTRRLLRRMAGCTVASEEEKGLVRRFAPDGLPLAVVPNGVDVKAYTGDFGLPHPDSLVFSGALTYSANFEAMHFFLTKVFPLIKSQCPDVTLRITGRTDGVPLETLSQQPGVVFTGYLDDVRPTIAQSKVSVVPLQQGGGTRLKILEAMALGTPVVSTTKGAEGLDATHGIDILLADRPTEFAKAVLHLLSDGALRARLAANGRRLVEERYSWATCAQQLEKLLNQVVEQRAGAG